MYRTPMRWVGWLALVNAAMTFAAGELWIGLMCLAASAAGFLFGYVLPVKTDA